MTVKELIEWLQGHDPELMVVCTGDEGRVDETLRVHEVNLKLNTDPKNWYLGNHEIVECETLPFDCKAVYIY